MTADTAEQQESIDRFYWSRGACCAGCDWWKHLNSIVGECTRGQPVAEKDRWSMLGITNCSLTTGAGHIMTTREHYCGEFKDSFDWASLPVPYLRRIGKVP